jgi:hypothetical protein
MQNTEEAGTVRAPRLGEAVHFVLFDELHAGQCRAGVINFNNADGSQNLTYFTAKQPGEIDNPPANTEFRFNRRHDSTSDPAPPDTWHYPEECPSGR